MQAVGNSREDASPLANGVISATASANGILVYSNDGAEAANQLGWYDKTGKLLFPVSAPGAVYEPAIAHDEKSVAFRRTTNGKSDIWVHDLDRGRETRITQNSSSSAPFWSPQNDRIVFLSAQNNVSELYQRLANGSGRDEPLLPGEISLWPSQWSRDGRYIVYFEVRSKNNRDIWVLPTEGNRRPIPFLKTEADEFMGQLSPDSHWMAFTSEKSGRREVYVRPFPPGEGEWHISVAGGRAPRWTRDGTEMVFVDADENMTAVAVKGTFGAKPSFEAGTPMKLFDANLAHAGLDTAFEYDVTADGNRFLIATAPRGAPAMQLTAVANWETALRKATP
jgi:dipeptidyl aminopeptidase/acylaminoacyl peptidase